MRTVAGKIVRTIAWAVVVGLALMAVDCWPDLDPPDTTTPDGDSDSTIPDEDTDDNDSEATLIVRGYAAMNAASYKLVYDTLQDITWLDYTNPYDTWMNQSEWVTSLTVHLGGVTYDDWRLPAALTEATAPNGMPCTGYDCVCGEMGHLYYVGLGNVGYGPLDGISPQPNWGLQNTGPFENLEPHIYWYNEGTEAPETIAWAFDFNIGAQQEKTAAYNRAIAVRDGDVAPSEFSIGDVGPAGGRIFYVDNQNEHEWTYLEVAPSVAEFEFPVPWGETGGEGIAVGTTGAAIGTGRANTAAIVEVYGEGFQYEDGYGEYAAKVCADLEYGGYADWFLPSIDELQQVYLNLFLADDEWFTVGGDDTLYWSSSEYNEDEANKAWLQSFADEGEEEEHRFHDFKPIFHGVRAARAF